MIKIINDTLLFQHVYGRSEHARLVALTSERTILYCLKHNIDYRLTFGEVHGDEWDGGHWSQVILMREYLNMGYKNVIYLDADTIIKDTNIDLRDAIVEDKIGAVYHVRVMPDRDLSHYNAGAFYVSNTPRIREFVDLWLSKYPGHPMSSFPLTREQGAFRILGEEMGIINRLDNKWNAEDGVSPSDHPVVMGFHGFPDLLHYMRIAIEGMEKV